MVWIEQPIGTGFTQGNATAKTEEDVAQQFLGFWRNFVDTFDLHKRKVYIAGESFAGMYIPYLADAMFHEKDDVYFKLKATMIYDPLVNSNAVMRQVPALAFVEQWRNVLGLNETFMKDIRERAERCGYSSFLQKYLEFPPKGVLPSPPRATERLNGGDCDVWGSVIDAAMLVNPVT